MIILLFSYFIPGFKFDFLSSLQFEAFKHGFDMVTEDSMLHRLFRPEELEDLLCGSKVRRHRSMSELGIRLCFSVVCFVQIFRVGCRSSDFERRHFLAEPCTLLAMLLFADSV